ncbi:MAG: hypothetical protein LBQ47_03655, partial [Endomicrobium sp.]|nr:hypothetical protein [Endomicrobium sp.]
MNSDDDIINEGNIWLNRIRNARNYESTYRTQSYIAYKLYNKNYEDYDNFIVSEKFKDNLELGFGRQFAKNNRSNIFYANIETLLSLVLPDVPSVKIELKNKYNYNQKPNTTQQFYDLAINVLQDTAQYFVKNSLKKTSFKKFKLDHFITGRGVLWVDYSVLDEKGTQSIDIDYVHWLNFAMDPKLEWNDVRWVARRRFVSKSQLKMLYPSVNFEDFNFTSNPYMTL